MYYGFWKENVRDHHGIYLWMKNYTDSISFEEISFDAYVGTIADDRFKKGTYLSKVNDEYFLYYGGFDVNGMKNDNEIFKRYREIKNFIKENMHTIDVLDDKEKFPDITKLCVGYNEKNIYSDIENKMKIK